MNMLSRFTLRRSLHGPYECFFQFPFIIIFLDAEEEVYMSLPMIVIERCMLAQTFSILKLLEGIG